MKLDQMRMILASGSPRRRELLSSLGLAFEVCVSDADETCSETEPGRIVEVLSAAKADAVYQMQEGDVLVIGSDTIVWANGRALGKPADEEEAFSMLCMLQGAVHEVYTGVSLFMRSGRQERKVSFHECTKVEFYPMSEEEIRSYIQTGDPMDKAGAYGIQSGAMKYVKGICGDYNTVVGLPVASLYQKLKELT